MQDRHTNYDLYFSEQAECCRRYYIPYIEENTGRKFAQGCNVLEVGCGIAGILSVFAGRGCSVTGVDIHSPSIERARAYFARQGLEGELLCANIFDMNASGRKYDLIVMHDTFEHIPDKERLLLHLKDFLSDTGVLYVAFPAWRMPFGGHQQVARSRFTSRCPYIHLLPRPVFKAVFRAFGETDRSLQTFLEIRDTRVTIRSFTRLIASAGFRVLDRRLYLINPSYEVKFGLRPRIMPRWIACIPYFRDFAATTCYYLLAR